MSRIDATTPDRAQGNGGEQSPAELCFNGHSVAENSRTASNGRIYCRQCSRDSSKRYWRRKHGKPYDVALSVKLKMDKLGNDGLPPCEVSDNCLECPLPICKHEPGGGKVAAAFLRQRDGKGVSR